jgi:hypothetical protein
MRLPLDQLLTTRSTRNSAPTIRDEVDIRYSMALAPVQLVLGCPDEQPATTIPALPTTDAETSR